MSKQKQKYAKEDSVVKIQNQYRVYLRRRKFKRSLYKLMIFKNIIDTRVHKEDMKLYRAFEALFFNARKKVE